MNKLTVEQVKQLFGCSWDALRKQYAAGAQDLCEIAAKARTTGRTVRGYTPEQAQAAADEMASRAAECAARVAQPTQSKLESLRDYQARCVANAQAAVVACDYPVEQMWRKQVEWFGAEIVKARATA